MLLRITAFACLGGFLYGYDLGLISGALTPIRNRFHPSEVTTELIVSAAKLGAIFGTFLGGASMLYYGRRTTIALDSIFFITGPLLMAFAINVTWLVAGRLLVGLGIGISAVVVPAYLSEVSPAHVRGRIVVCYEFMLCLGMLSAMLVDAALMHLPWNWRWMVGAPLIPGIVLSFSLVVLPESPRWLLVQGRLDEALSVIHSLYTKSSLPRGVRNSTAEVEQELLQMWSSVEKDRDARRQRRAQARDLALSRKTQNSGPLKIVTNGDGPLCVDNAEHEQEATQLNGTQDANKSGEPAKAEIDVEETPPGFWRTFGTMLLDVWVVARGPERNALCIALTLGFVSQAIASTAIINYAPQLLEKSGLKSNSVSTLLSAIVPAAKVVGVSVGIALVDIAGRRPLLIFGSAGCAGSMVLLFAADMIRSISFEVVAMCLFIISFSSSFAGVFWVIVGELFSMSAKSPAASATTAMLFAAGFAADQLFLTMLDHLGSYCFLIFGGIAAAGGIFSFFKVPETKRRTLAEIQAMMSGIMPAVPTAYNGKADSPAAEESEVAQMPFQHSTLLAPGAIRSDEVELQDASKKAGL